MAPANLIIQTAFVGDVLLAIPLIRAVKKLCPENPVALVCREPLGDFFRKTKIVDQIYEINKKDRRSWHSLKSELRRQRFHWVLAPHESWRTARLVSLLKADQKIGFRHWWNGWVFDHRISRPMNWPDALRQLSLLTVLDESWDEMLKAYSARWESLPTHHTSEASMPPQWGDLPEWASMRLPDECFAQAPPRSTLPVVVLAPGSVWPTKRWREEGFIELGQHYARRGFQVAVVGSPAERDIGERVAKGIPGAVNLAGQTDLYAMAQLFRTAKLLVTNDSGAMHMASVAGLPTVAVFGPTTLEFGYRPWQAQAWVVQAPLACRPCSVHGGKSCPLGTHECMRRITPTDILHTPIAKL